MNTNIDKNGKRARRKTHSSSDDNHRLATAIAKLGSPDRVESFFRDLLTPSEFEIVSRRWKIMELLAAGVPQRAIASELGVSLCKITRGAKILKNPKSPLAVAVNK